MNKVLTYNYKYGDIFVPLSERRDMIIEAICAGDSSVYKALVERWVTTSGDSSISRKIKSLFQDDNIITLPTKSQIKELHSFQTLGSEEQAKQATEVVCGGHPMEMVMFKSCIAKAMKIVKVPSEVSELPVNHNGDKWHDHNVRTKLATLVGQGGLGNTKQILKMLNAVLEIVHRAQLERYVKALKKLITLLIEDEKVAEGCALILEEKCKAIFDREKDGVSKKFNDLVPTTIDEVLKKKILYS